MATALVSGWDAGGIDGCRRAYFDQLDLGSLARRRRSASTAATVVGGEAKCRAGRRADQSLLRTLDAGWEVFCLPGDEGRPVRHLVDAWEGEFSRTAVSIDGGAGAVDERAIELAGASVQPGRA